jgi:hypothetical protein
MAAQPVTTQPTKTEAVPPTAPEPVSAAAQPPAESADSKAIDAIVAEIRQTQALDAKAEEELVHNLRASPPHLWPLVTQQFRAALAYRRQVEEQQRLAAKPGSDGRPAPAPPGVYQTATGATSTQPNPIRPLAPPPASEAQTPPEPDRTANTPEHNNVLPQLQGGNCIRSESGSNAPKSLPPRPECLAGSSNVESPAVTAAAEHAAANPPADASANRVTPVSYDPHTPPGDWRLPLADTIRSLESRVSPTPQSAEEVADHARLRMLYLAVGRRDDALRPIPSLSPAMQDFWSKEFCGMAALLDTQRTPDALRRAGEAQRHLSDAITRLGESAPLVVRNLTFVTDVQSYGSFKPFEKGAFHPGQRVLLYAEVENFKSKETPRGFQTSLQSSYQIFDSRNQRVAEHEFGTNEEQCHNPRRDFFIGYEFFMPKQIYPGKHTLQLTVTDLNGDKIGQSSVEFAIASSGE